MPPVLTQNLLDFVSLIILESAVADCQINMIIRAKIFKVAGGTAGDIKKQKPLLIPYVPEIATMHDRTINLSLEHPLLVGDYDVETKSIEWEINRWEKFRFIRARIQFCPCEPSYDKAIPCLLFFAEASPYHYNPYIIEVITPKCDLKGVTEFLIHLAKPCTIVVGDKRVV